MSEQSYNSYVHISPWYDQIMCHVDYAEWAGYISKVLTTHGVAPKKIIELGAGTCQHARFLDFGPDSYSLYTDLSYDMLDNAWSKNELNRACCDMKSLPFKQSFDLVMLMYDAFNYLVSEYDVEDMFNEVHRVLLPGGFFLFDITTEYNSESYFLDESFHEDYGEFEYVRNSWYDPDNRFQHNDFTYFIKGEDGRYSKITEDHIQKVYSLKTVTTLCKQAGFKMVGTYSGMTMKKPNAKSLRVHLLVQKI